MNRILLTTLIAESLFGCGYTEPRCTIRENIVLQEQRPEAVYEPYKCEAVAKALDIISEISRNTVTDVRFYFYDYKIEKSTISVNIANSWRRAPDNKLISGQTLCSIKLSEINSAQNIYDSSLAHELAHLVQNCTATPEAEDGDTNEDPDHRNWHRDGIYKMIDLVEAIE